MKSPREPQFPAESTAKGEFVRQRSRFRDWVRADGSTAYQALAGRYHLYVSYACPWAHRTIIVRRLKRLEAAIGLTVVDPIRDRSGWTFTEAEGCGPDPVNGFSFLSEAYKATDAGYEGRCTVPVLWDRETRSIVNNESSEIIRMLNSEFDEWGDASLDLYPEQLRGEIDAINERVYATVNNGVYRVGFATSQTAYDRAVTALFEMLQELEDRLARQRYLVGEQPTEADWRLFPTLVRFDPVYVGHFKCNLQRLVDLPNLWAYTRELYQVPGVADTVNMDHIKRHYYQTHREINPHGVVPLGPLVDFDQPHGRG